jgi:hypothetical protein
VPTLETPKGRRVLKEFLLNPTLLADIPFYQFGRTSSYSESFANVCTVYALKQKHFRRGYHWRVNGLAVLHWQENVNRERVPIKAKRNPLTSNRGRGKGGYRLAPPTFRFKKKILEAYFSDLFRKPGSLQSMGVFAQKLAL